MTSSPTFAPESLTILAAAADEAIAGHVVVDVRDGRLRVVYANEAFAVRIGIDADALADLAGDCDAADPLRRRIAYHDGGAALVVEVVTTRHVLGGQGPWLLLIVHDVDEAPAEADADDASEWLRCAAVASGAGHWHWDLAAGSVWYEERFKTLLGYGRADIDDTFAALQAPVHDDERPLLLQALRLHIEQRGPFDLKLRIRPGR